MKVLTRLLIALLIGVPAWAGQIRGRVLNAQGSALAGASISVASPQGENLAHAATAEDGTYAIPGLPPGSYILTVAAPSVGSTLSRQVVIPESGEAVQADFQFQPAAAASGIAAEERNPNIFVYRIDLNDLRNRLTVARGPDPTYVAEFAPDKNYFGAEYGAPLLSYEILRPRSLANSWRGSLLALHQNSAVSARNFFNVGPLQASRATTYSITANGPLFFEKDSLLLQFGQSLSSGAVNGNIQSPLDSERVPITTDPQKRAVIESLLRAYPLESPNLGERRLNSNASRNIDSVDALGRYDYRWSESRSLAFRYTINDYSEEPFQLVAGQNPQTDVRTQAAYLSLTQSFSPAANGRLAFNFDRTAARLLPTKRFTDLFASLLLPDVPDLDFSADQFTDVGPGAQFPRKRFQNRFQLYADVSRRAGRHTLSAGWSTTRVQVNDLQSDNARGTFRFAGDFGRTEIQNFLLGTPSSFTIAIGNFYRGFRNWEHFGYLQDQLQLSPSFSLSAGVRYELITVPTEVNQLTRMMYRADKNNFAPRFGFAWNPGRGQTVVRGGYGISYAAILPVSYGMARFNPPQVQVYLVQAPDLLHPLAGSTARPSSQFLLSPDLIPAYSHQYTLAIERALPGAMSLRAAYLGSRTFHLLTQQVYNRARPSAVLPNTTATVQARRPNPNLADINVIESNANAYYDALQLTLDKRISRGLAFRAVYTFGKNIDTGGDFTNTATGVERPPETGITTCEECDRISDHKGVSLFDTPHALVFSYSYLIPFRTASRWANTVLSGWQVSGTTIFQSGIPYHLHTGSDGPGLGNVDGVSQDRPNITNSRLLGSSFDDPDTSVQRLGADTCRLLSPGEVPAGVAPYIRCSSFDSNLPLGGRGNLGWNTFRKDGTHNWNVSLGKTFSLPGGRERTVQFRAEFINFFNHAIFDKPNVQMSSPIFGQITNTANKGRQIQFSLRLNL